MIGAVGMVVAIVVFVMAHETGHYLAAKATGMKVTEYFVGFGPRLWSTRRGETEYGVKAIPLGGYVRIIGMNPLEEVDPADEGRTYREKKFWQKSVVVLSGVAVNFLLAFLILFGLSWYSGVATVEPRISEVESTLDDGSVAPASAAGLEAGDLIVSVEGRPVVDWVDLVDTISSRPGETVVMTVERDAAVVTVTATLASIEEPDGGQRGFLGVAPTVVTESIGLFRAAGLAGQDMLALTKDSLGFLWNLVQPRSLAELAGTFFGDTEVPDEIRPVSPVGVAQLGSQAETVGVANLIFLLAAVNVILGILNSLPLFPLDGGHFAVALYEKIFRRQADVRKLAPVAAAVIALIVFLGVVAIYLDFVNPIDVSG